MTKKKPVSKGKNKVGRPKSKVKRKPAAKQLDDSSYFKLLGDIEKKRIDDIVSGKQVAIGEVRALNSNGVLEHETLIKNNKGKLVPEYKLIKKGRPSARRPPVKTEMRECTKCGAKAEIAVDIAGEYCYNSKKVDSPKPFFTCGRCG